MNLVQKSTVSFSFTPLDEAELELNSKGGNTSQLPRKVNVMHSKRNKLRLCATDCQEEARTHQEQTCYEEGQEIPKEMMLTKTDSSRKTSAKHTELLEAGGGHQVPGVPQVPAEVEMGHLVHTTTVVSSPGL